MCLTTKYHSEQLVFKIRHQGDKDLFFVLSKLGVLRAA